MTPRRSLAVSRRYHALVVMGAAIVLGACGHEPPNSDRISAAAKAVLESGNFGEVAGFPEVLVVERNVVSGDGAVVVTNVEYYAHIGLIKRRVQARCDLALTFARGTWFGSGGRCERVSLGSAEPALRR